MRRFRTAAGALVMAGAALWILAGRPAASFGGDRGVALTDRDTVPPAELAPRVAADAASKPAVYHVGFAVLYRSRHIPGSIYAGPAAKPEGLELLKKEVSKLPRDREIVLYCGCCPWDKCPNVRPAFALLREMGFQRVKVLKIPDNFAHDWIDKGYPVTGRN